MRQGPKETAGYVCWVRDALRDFIQHQVGDFEDLALALHAWQRAHNPELDRFCPDHDPRHWSEIPAVPVGLFRDLALTCFPVEHAQIVFRTSGTTGTPGQVHLRDTELYDLGARIWAEQCLGPLPDRGIFLLQDNHSSSLSHMCRSFVQQADWFVGESLDTAGALKALAQANKPVFVAGTAFAWADVVETNPPPVQLPEGSQAMVTGGFKGRRRIVDDDGLRHGVQTLLPNTPVVGEYGMTELSSQLWSTQLGGAFRPPPWMRVLAVDPWTGAPTEEGLLRFFDLANQQTTLAIETADWGRVLSDGTVELSGRMPGAEPRGCSLSLEDLSR